MVTESNAFVRGGGNRVFETDAAGRVIRDITPNRVKVLEINVNPDGEVFHRFRKIEVTDSDLEILRRMGVGND